MASLSDRLLLTLRFMEEVQDFPSGPDFRNMVERMAEQGDLRTLKVLARDVDAMTLTLSSDEKIRLSEELKKRTGAPCDDPRAALAESVAVALRRGHIASERERRRVEEYVELLEITGGDEAEISTFEKLLRGRK